MKQKFTLEIHSDNNFSVLNRIVNVLNRRRVRIKKLIAHENEEDFTRGWRDPVGLYNLRHDGESKTSA